MANEQGEPFVLDFPNGQRVEDILKKAQSDYSKAEIDAKMSSKANAEDVYSKSAVDTALDNKVDKETGKGLSTNDYTTAEKNKLASIEAQANKTVVDDTLDDSSTNPVQNKVVKAALDSKADTADIPTVPITNIQKNGTGITPVGGTVNITVPTQASDINAATATQGDKADTAIQGIKVNSSTVNPDSNKVVSITIPTAAADVSALPDTTKYAAALSLTINSSTFVMTGQLKDQNGDNLGTAQTIDLPLESVVVGGSYNSQTKKIVLTLQNGNTIEFSVADLVSGLQTELSASNKLNPAYINYDSAHRAVSDTEKSTWNGKQNALSSAQLAAVNSGINSEKVAQFDSTTELEAEDRAALIELIDDGAKNVLDLSKAKSVSCPTELSYTIASDGTLTVTWSEDLSSSGRALRFVGMPHIDGTYILSGAQQATTSETIRADIRQGTSSAAIVRDYGQTPKPFAFGEGDFTYAIRIQTVAGSASFKPMICSVPAWKISQAYQPYRPSYQELYEMVKALQAAT